MNAENNVDIEAQTEHLFAARALLAGALIAACKTLQPSETDRIVRREVHIEACDALAWLRAQPVAEKVFWTSRGGNTTYAGIGCASAYTGTTPGELHAALGAIQVLLATHSTARYYGGARFDMERDAEPHWLPYSGFAFRLPRMELTVCGATATLAVQGIVAAHTSPETELTLMLNAVRSMCIPEEEAHCTPSIPAPLQRDNTPDREHWEENINAALHSFASGETSKIALARCAAFAFSESLHPLHFVHLLQQAEQRAFVFCFQLDAHRAFVGATPERLYQRAGNTLHTEAVAGTRKRGATPQEDALLREELWQSDKEQREHELVREHLRTVLERHGSITFEQHPAAIMTLPRVHHLHSPFEAALNDGVFDADLLPDLHPTPAVAGLPQRASVHAIAAIEQFDRGWYTGPIGYIGHNDTEFAVAIRSGLVENTILRLYSGAGIVPGSEAEAEWNEIEHKLGGFLALLHGEK